MKDAEESKGRSEEPESNLSRRSFLQAGALAAGAALAPLSNAAAQSSDAAAEQLGALIFMHPSGSTLGKRLEN